MSSDLFVKICAVLITFGILFVFASFVMSYFGFDDNDYFEEEEDFET